MKKIPLFKLNPEPQNDEADRKYKRGALALTIPCAARFMPDKLTFYKLFAAPHPPTAGIRRHGPGVATDAAGRRV